MKNVIFVLMICLVTSGVQAKTLYQAADGWLIYDAGSSDYRFGPSIIINDDNSIDMWMASPGTGTADGEWDWVRYKRSTDGGHTWTAETIVLKPTAGSRDHYSVCDPGVIKFGGYYYIGYTSTEDSSGNINQIYVARSSSPTSGFEKWNGSGWGGNPQPIIAYTGTTWGAGEPSFVVKDSVLYIYYTWDWNTRVATADATNANWPATIALNQGTIARHDNEDSTDVKYVDASGKFVAVGIASRLTADSYMTVRESTDGLNFVEVAQIANIQPWAHNCGISGTANGHISLTKSNFIAYAYGETWGSWDAHMNPLSIIPISAGDLNEDGYVNFADFALLAKDWLLCTYPGDTQCQYVE